MKKIVKLSMVAAALAAAFAFASCANESAPVVPFVLPTATPVTTTGSVTAPTTDSNGNKTASLTASNGTYKFTETAGSNASTSIVSRAATVDTSKSGTWTFTETGAQNPKYTGTYQGDIPEPTSEEVKLSFTVNKILKDGNLKNVTAVEFDFSANVSLFNATIPSVSVITISDATTTVTEYAFNSDELNNKIFFTKADNNTNQWVIFTGNKCYTGGLEGDARSKQHEYPTTTIIKTGNKLYKSTKFSRISGSGLFATFKNDAINAQFTIDSDGTVTSKMQNGGQEIIQLFDITNDSGVITVTSNMGTTKMYYNGTDLYSSEDKFELYFLNPYGTVASDTSASVTELAHTAEQLNNKIFYSAGKYYKFADGKCYESSNRDMSNPTDKTAAYPYVVSASNVLRLCRDKLDRVDSTSTGLYTSWSYNSNTYTFSSNGNVSVTPANGTTPGSATFTNAGGVIAIYSQSEGTAYGIWNGTDIYQVYTALSPIE